MEMVVRHQLLLSSHPKNGSGDPLSLTRQLLVFLYDYLTNNYLLLNLNRMLSQKSFEMRDLVLYGQDYPPLCMYLMMSPVELI